MNTRTWLTPLLFLAATVQSAPAQGIVTHTLDWDIVVGDDADYLTKISDIVLAADGSVYVAQPEEQLIRIFDERARAGSGWNMVFSRVP